MARASEKTVPKKKKKQKRRRRRVAGSPAPAFLKKKMNATAKRRGA
jgi:hypothetical protein